MNRLAWTPEDEATREWFTAQARGLGREVERDPAGNLWALPTGDGPWWAVGSHLDSVRDGGLYDGPLGVAAAFAVAARLEQPVAVVSFADEEGARFNTPTFGSRALVGRLDVDDVLARRDDDGVSLRDAMEAAGLDPDGLARAPEWLGRMRGMVELHIDQTRDLAAAGSPAGVVTALASRLRLQVDLSGPRRPRRHHLPRRAPRCDVGRGAADRRRRGPGRRRRPTSWSPPRGYWSSRTRSPPFRLTSGCGSTPARRSRRRSTRGTRSSRSPPPRLPRAAAWRSSWRPRRAARA